MTFLKGQKSSMTETDKRKEMIILALITDKIKKIKQPEGGYLNINKFKIEDYGKITRSNETENIDASIIDNVVYCLACLGAGWSWKRFQAFDAFAAPLMGAYNYDNIMGTNKASKYATSLLKNMCDGSEIVLSWCRDGRHPITDTDSEFITDACNIAKFSIFFDSDYPDISTFDPTKRIVPDSATIENIFTMVNRCTTEFREHLNGGIPWACGFGYGSLWNITTSENELTGEEATQLLMYHIISYSFNNNYRYSPLVIFNPRLGKKYTIEHRFISPEIVEEIKNAMSK